MLFIFLNLQARRITTPIIDDWPYKLRSVVDKYMFI